MSRLSKGMLTLLIVTSLAACVSKEEFNAFRTEVRVWAHGGTIDTTTYEGVKNWQLRTWEAICDIYRVNTPDRGGTPPAYSAETDAYCLPDTDGNGKPDEPPPFGL